MNRADFSYRQRLSGGSLPQGGAGFFAASGPIGKALGVVVGVVAVLAAMAMSVVALGAILVVGAVAGAWFWWRTRDLRRQLRAEMARMQAMAGTRPSGAAPARTSAGQGQILDGDFIREAPPAGSAGPRPSR